MKKQEKCPYCGAYLHIKPFYVVERVEGVLQVWVCQNCGSRVKIWIKS